MNLHGKEIAAVVGCIVVGIACTVMALVDGGRWSASIKDIMIILLSAYASWILSEASGRERQRQELQQFGNQAAERIWLPTYQLRMLARRIKGRISTPGELPARVDHLADQLERISVWSEASLRDWEAQLGRKIELREQMQIAGAIEEVRQRPAEPPSEEQRDLVLRDLARLKARLEGKAHTPPAPTLLEHPCPACGTMNRAALGTNSGETRHVDCHRCGCRFVLHRRSDGSMHSKELLRPAPSPVSASALPATKKESPQGSSGQVEGSAIRKVPPGADHSDRLACPECGTVIGHTPPLRLPATRVCLACRVAIRFAANRSAMVERTAVTTTLDHRGSSWVMPCPIRNIGYSLVKTTRPWAIKPEIVGYCGHCFAFLRADSPAEPVPIADGGDLPGRSWGGLKPSPLGRSLRCTWREAR